MRTPVGLFHQAADGRSTDRKFACHLRQRHPATSILDNLLPIDIQSCPNNFPTFEFRPMNSRLTRSTIRLLSSSLIAAMMISMTRPSAESVSTFSPELMNAIFRRLNSFLRESALPSGPFRSKAQTKIHRTAPAGHRT